MEKADLAKAYEGSYYFIAGAGGELSDWTNGVQGIFDENEIGTVTAWFQTTGGEINDFAALRGPVTNPFQRDLTCILFPLDGLNVNRLAILRLMAGDRWFDDVINTMYDTDAYADVEDEEL